MLFASIMGHSTTSSSKDVLSTHFIVSQNQVFFQQHDIKVHKRSCFLDMLTPTIGGAIDSVAELPDSAKQKLITVDDNQLGREINNVDEALQNLLDRRSYRKNNYHYRRNRRQLSASIFNILFLLLILFGCLFSLRFQSVAATADGPLSRVRRQQQDRSIIAQLDNEIRVDRDTFHAAEQQLLKRFGLTRKPSTPKAIVVPDFMFELYRQQAGITHAELEQQIIMPRRKRPIPRANTARSFVHQDVISVKDANGTSHSLIVASFDENAALDIEDNVVHDKPHRNSLVFDISTIPANETLRAAELRLHVEHAGDLCLPKNSFLRINVYDVSFRMFSSSKQEDRKLVRRQLLDTGLVNLEHVKHSVAGTNNERASISLLQSDADSERHMGNGWFTFDVLPAVARWHKFHSHTANKSQPALVYHGLQVEVHEGATNRPTTFVPCETQQLGTVNPEQSTVKSNLNSEYPVRVKRSAEPAAVAEEPRRSRNNRMSNHEWAARQPLVVVYTNDQNAAGAERPQADHPAARRQQQQQTHPTNSKSPHHRRRTTHTGRRRTTHPHNCRRRPLYVDFTEVGWDNWIVAPVGYHAYFCQGNCPFPLADHLNSTNHAIVQTLVNSVNPNAAPRACCIPTDLSPISMLYLDEYSKVVLKNYQSMVVEGCGCR